MRVGAIDTSTLINLALIDRLHLTKDLEYHLVSTEVVAHEIRTRGRPEIQRFFEELLRTQGLMMVPLSVEDVMEMATVPHSKRISDPELSCFVLAQRLRSMLLIDDSRAIKFITNNASHLAISSDLLVRTLDLLCDGHCKKLLTMADLEAIEQLLASNRFRFSTPLGPEAARRREMFAGATEN